MLYSIWLITAILLSESTLRIWHRVRNLLQMLLKQVVRCAARNFSKTTPNRVLSSNFALEKEWSARHSDLGKLGLGGDYEWISAVQKKFIGGGYASAVDVDAAVCIAEQKDQVDDVVEMLYKLRHSVKAAEKLDSSEYAIVRLLLKYQPDMILTLANDPVSFRYVQMMNNRISDQLRCLSERPFGLSRH